MKPLIHSVMVALSLVMASASAEDVPWLAEIQKPPETIPDVNIGLLKPLLQTDTGVAVTTARDWQQRRMQIRSEWLEFLGPMPSPRPEVKLKVIDSRIVQGDCKRLRVEYENEPGQWIDAYLLLPENFDPKKKYAGVIALHPTTAETIAEIAGVLGRESRQQGIQLCQLGYVVFCPRNFLWQDVEDYREAVARHQQKHPKSLGMAKMLYDAQRGVDVLAALDYVDHKRIGAFGHSLGAKEVLYLAAFDKRIAVGVASEGGLGLGSTNWDAPWYLGKAIQSPDFPLNHHQLLALIAPRPFLVLGGESGRGAADGKRSWPILREAMPVYELFGQPVRLGLYNHGMGHDIPPKVNQRIQEWFTTYLPQPLFDSKQDPQP